jgi:glycosyltransferase involved in cell wall biosynthesis
MSVGAAFNEDEFPRSDLSQEKRVEPLVSILIPCFNSERWVGGAIESALTQTWPAKEVIVIDDGSTDRSLKIIRRFEGHIRWESGSNRGGNAARNRLLELARGDWLQYLDADDYLLPDKITKQVQFLIKHPDAEIVFGPVTLEHWSERKIRLEPLPIPELHDLWVLLARWWLPQTGAPLWRKQAIVDVGGWKSGQPCCQEHELYLRLLIAGKRFEYCSTNGAIYRQWGNVTICKKNPREVHRRRLEIVQLAQEHLQEKNQLTSERLTAINQGRFEIARAVWQYEAAFATDIMRAVQKDQPLFIPCGTAAPARYRLMYRSFGFAQAERIARWMRCFRREKVI